MRLLNPEKLGQLQKEPKNIRNICIVAHVDHGKTTLADSLVASNGIISPRMAGKLRYMDSRKDEQERGITMKSSSITLYHVCEEEEFLVNLIDSPGHVDFSSEVSTAVRLCDGAVLVVDVVEGVCPQTQVALKQAWQESIKPVLVLNKIDRLILEMKLTPLDAYIHMTQVLEQVNAIVGQLFTRDVLEKACKEGSSSENNQEGVYDWGDGLEEADDSTLYFSPDQGNVIFASAIDGWGFCINDFVKLYSTKLGLKEAVLRKTLWGNYFYNPKTKTVKKGAQEKAKKPLFVQLVLENIWAMYETICVRKDREKMAKMIEALGVKVLARDMRHSDPKVQLQAVCSQWLPVSKSVLDMVCRILPPANQLSEEKVEKLMCSNNQTFESYPLETQRLKKAFLDCSSHDDAPVIVFVSKMFPMERKNLPQNRPAVLTPEELAERRETVKQRLAERKAAAEEEALNSSSASSREHSTDSSSNEPNAGSNYPNSGPEVQTQETPPLPEDVFIAFARVYSGTLRKGSTVYVLGPKHDPAAALSYVQEEGDISEEVTLKDLKPGHHATKTKVGDIYLMMGRELETVPEAFAGNVIGIGGLEEHVLKSATLSSELACPSFSELNLMAVPILRVAVEPVRPADMPSLVKGLKLLNQADACVQVIVQESGEHVLVTAGEVHLERCIDDLKTRYAKVDVTVSEPIIPFRETVVPPPKVDMVNEVIEQAKKPSQDDANDGLITMFTPNKQAVIQILCAPIPPAVTDILEKNSKLLKTWDKFTSKKFGFLVESLSSCKISTEDSLSVSKSHDRTKDTVVESAVPEKLISELLNFKDELKAALKDSEGIWCPEIVDCIWSFGPRRCGPNILVNQIEGFGERNVWKDSNLNDPKMEYDSSFVNGFQMATLAGPLCEEPMMGVAFFVKKWDLFDNVGNPGNFGPLSGQIMSTVKEACRKSFQAQPQRLMAAMYTCNIQANQEVLGKMYAVLGRRHGRILAGDMTQGSATFTVTAVLPVVESFNFAAEIRKQTSGLAQPQLVFSHWEVIEIDPFWSPNTEEEYLLYGEKADTENKARQYMNSVRRRKGLTVEEKIVQHAEKQRTLGRNK